MTFEFFFFFDTDLQNVKNARKFEFRGHGLRIHRKQNQPILFFTHCWSTTGFPLYERMCCRGNCLHEIPIGIRDITRYDPWQEQLKGFQSLEVHPVHKALEYDFHLPPPPPPPKALSI